MKSRDFLNRLPIILLVPFFNLGACTQNESKDHQNDENVRVEVVKMCEQVSGDISSNGPSAWLNYFEHSTDFFMASDGKVEFRDYNAAEKFINDTLIHALRSIDLKWGKIRIDPLTQDLALVGMDFTEKLVDQQGKEILLTGYFTALVHKADPAWRLRNIHWSIRHNDLTPP